MAVHVSEILAKFPELVTHVRGPTDQPLSALNDPAQSSASDLIFVMNPKILKGSSTIHAQAWVVHTNMISLVPESVTTLLASPNPSLAMARIAKSFFPQKDHHQIIRGAKIHNSAQISSTARLGENVLVGPGAIVGDDCEIGDNAVIGANSVLEPRAMVGPRTHIYPLVFIGHGCQIGADCEIHPHTTIGTEGFGYAYDVTYRAERLTHYGRVILEDRVHIGAGVQIDRGTFLDSRIGADTKIDNHCHFAHNIEIGRNTIIAGGVVAAGSVKIGSYCVVGGCTTIGGHLEIVDKTKISGASVLSKSILEPGEYGGFPIQPISDTLKTRSSLRHLPHMRKQLKSVLKHLGLKDEDQ